MTTTWVPVLSLGLVSSLGSDPARVLGRVDGKQSSWSPLPFPSRSFPLQDAGLVTDITPSRLVRRKKELKVMSRDAVLALAAARSAFELLPGRPDPSLLEEVGLYMGVGLESGDPDEVSRAATASATGEDESFDAMAMGERGLRLLHPLAPLLSLPNMPLGHLAIQLGLRGPNLALSPGAASSVAALAEATEAIRNGVTSCVLAGGADCRASLSAVTMLCRWQLTEPPPGEAAAFMLLGRLDGGLRPLAAAGGYAMAASPSLEPGQAPSGAVVESAVDEALSRSGITRKEVDRVHLAVIEGRGERGTSRLLLEEMLPAARISCAMEVLGYTGAAAGAVEAVLAAEAISSGSCHSALVVASDMGRGVVALVLGAADRLEDAP